MRKILSFSLIATFGFAFLCGCGNPMLKMATKNREAMAGLKPGLTPKEVEKVMDREPYNTEFFRGKAGEGVLVYKYLTRPAKHGSWSYVGDDDLTPMIFVNDVLEGWGWSFLEATSQKYGFVFKVKN